MSAHGPPQLIVFDWDGTLVDSVERIVGACLRAFRDCGVPAPDPGAVRALIGLGLDETFARLAPAADAAERRRLATRYRECWALAAAEPPPLFAGAREALRALSRRGTLLAVATGKSRRGLDRDMGSLDVRTLFAASRCADEAPSKPDPGMLLDLMIELGVPAADTLMIGDSGYDLEMAMRAGVRAVAVRSGVHGEERLREFAPAAILDHVGDLPHWAGIGTSSEDDVR